MKKFSKKASIVDEEAACEIIELATGDIETLAKAFDLIAESCADSSCEELFQSSEEPRVIVH